MTAIAKIETVPPPAFGLSDMERIANAIARGGLFGSKDPYAVLTLCMLAQAEGQHPAVVFRDYHLIGGKPAKKAEAMQRDFLAAGGKIEWHTLTDDCADATFSHPMGGSARISWDKARVKQAQLGGNAMHTKYPRQMLRSRVISEGVRTVFPGATSGLYVPEEVQDFTSAADPAQSAPAPLSGAMLIDQATQQPATPPPAKPRMTPQEWASLFTGSLASRDTLEAVDELVTTNTAALDKLAGSEPAIYAAVELAIEARRAAVAVPAEAGGWEPGIMDAG